ncbi:MAG TPA: hypothetical protein VE692_03280, partial [Nitrososphaera sp.]|nr:hypothetical protein [Nitrososphaera sp.]
DRKRLQLSKQQMSTRTKYIDFVSDKERKLLSFTGKFDKQEVPAKDFETGQVIPGKYVTRYLFECYDITTTATTTTEVGGQEKNSPNSLQSEPSIWNRGTKDARTILYYLSKNKKVLEVIRNGQPRSKTKTTTYQINPPLD